MGEGPESNNNRGGKRPSAEESDTLTGFFAFLIDSNNFDANDEMFALSERYTEDREAVPEGVPHLNRVDERRLGDLLHENGYMERAQNISAGIDVFVESFDTLNPFSSENDTQATPEQFLPKNGEWNICVQETECITRANGKELSTGVITVVSPEGETHSFEFSSGGHGKGPLPGLGRDDTSSMAYELRWDSFVVNNAGLPKGMLDSSGRGSWLKIGEGIGEAANTSRGGFGIHTDGNVPGSLGCIVLDPGVDKQLFEVLASIPADQRPSEMMVLPKADILSPERTPDPDQSLLLS